MIPGIGVPIILVRASALYPFTSFTFTPAGVTGRYGPTLAQCQTAYAGQVWLASYFTVPTQGYQTWTVPATGTYNIAIGGSRSGNPIGYSLYASGAIINARFSLTAGQTLTMIIGQYTDTSYTGNLSSYYGLGGGGGTFVSYGGNILIAAGGAGGASYFSSGGGGAMPGQNGQTTTSGGAGLLGYGVGGTGGSGGSRGGFASPTYWGGCGAGWIGVGQNGNGTTTHPFPQTNYFGEGGYTQSVGFYGGDYNYSWGNPTGYSSTYGGFGGGGGGNGIISGGAGGGYSGGGVGSTNTYSASCGGGGSYVKTGATSVQTSDGNYAGSSTFEGDAIVNLAAYNSNIGYVTITKI